MRLVALLLALAWTGIAAADQNSAFQDGMNLGGSLNQGAFSGITSGAAQDKIPAYGTAPGETQYYQGGQGSLSGPGVAKMQNCATSAPDSDPIKRQECEAINFLARNPQIRPQFNLSKTDPMFTNAKNISDNAESFFQSSGMGGTGSSTQCVTTTQTTPGQYTTETCSTIREIGEEQCTMGRVVNVDTDANFQCEQTVKSYEQLTCQKKLNVTVTQIPSCSYGSVIAYSTTDGRDGPYGLDVVQVLGICEFTSNNTLRFRSYAHGGSGACTTFDFYLPATGVSSKTLLGTQQPHWLGYCNTVTAYSLPSPGCNGNNCSYSFLFEWPTRKSCELVETCGFVLGTGWTCTQEYQCTVPSWTVNISVNRPHLDTSVSSSWDNRCSTLEARSQ